MTEVGMGVLYTKTSKGEELRSQKYAAGVFRDRLLNEYYSPHHTVFEELVDDKLLRGGAAAIIDCHSFPSKPLPYEFDQNPNRPDICIGTDEFHTPRSLREGLENGFRERGYSVELNAPFSGAIVPLRYYGTNSGVVSVMVEINRSLCMDQDTLEKRQSFDRVGRDILSCLENQCAEFARQA